MLEFSPIQSKEQSSIDRDSRQPTSGSGPKFSSSSKDQFLLVLMCLRLGLLEWDLAKHFGVCEASILVHWINYMYLQLGSLPIWPSGDSFQRRV